ncbi:MAG: C4-dicarboxylate ABC transporter substrate-binding protein, partial [Desulfobacula sp.]|nr:C4-dicarboxylate ABC transporter substrate-binding protein [Desulfobacula sp.]
PFAVVMNKAKYNSLPKDVQKVMMDLKEEQSLWTGTYMDEQIKKSIAWSKESNNVEFISLSAAEKAKWDGKLTFITEKWIKGAKEKGLPAEEIINDIKSYIQ